MVVVKTHPSLVLGWAVQNAKNSPKCLILSFFGIQCLLYSQQSMPERCFVVLSVKNVAAAQLCCSGGSRAKGSERKLPEAARRAAH